MKRIKSVNGYTIYQATTQRDADNYGCDIGSYNIYLSSDIRDFGLTNSYPEYDNLDSLAYALVVCNSSRYAVAAALADELSQSTAQDMDLTLAIEQRLDAGEAVSYVRDCYDPETGILHAEPAENPYYLDSDHTWLDDVVEQYVADCHADDDDELADDDVDPDAVIDALAAGELDDAPKQEPRSHASYAVLRDPDDDQYYTIAAPCTEGLDTQERRDDWLLATVAKHIAFSDCGGYDVIEVVVDGRRVEYVGWQPGMLYEFADCETGEIIWSVHFPEWDH